MSQAPAAPPSGPLRLDVVTIFASGPTTATAPLTTPRWAVAPEW